MIAVTDLHGRKEYINAELIERIQSNPDTQVVLLNGQRVYVAETPETLVERVMEYRRACGGRLPMPIAGIQDPDVVVEGKD